MSGNGPLVKVLQAVLARHQMSDGVRSLNARLHAKTLIENVHVFARTYTDDPQNRAPSNHVVIFDEAQRAWDRAQNLAKFKRDYSEPEMLLKIMERHQDWAVVIALVGGGQEINNGEAGLEEWGRSLAQANKPWTVYASPEAIQGGTSVAGGRLTTGSESTLNVFAEAQLHLDVSVRSLNADSYARWVNHVVNGDASQAAEVSRTMTFPVMLTRDLEQLRRSLEQKPYRLQPCGACGLLWRCPSKSGRPRTGFRLPCWIPMGALVSCSTHGRPFQPSTRSLRNRVRNSGLGTRLDWPMLGRRFYLVTRQGRMALTCFSSNEQ